MEYNFIEIEKKWQEKWKTKKAFATNLDQEKNNYYALTMFPYPSGQGLHVGHILGYVATDVIARHHRHLQENVFFPMGWDAFGLPAEQYAIETGNDPDEFSLRNIEIFKSQIRSVGLSIDWKQELRTSDPNYYKWTQWIFTKLYERGLAYIASIEVNWCEKLGTVLANEEVLLENGKMISERGGYPVVKKPMKQWVLKITEYADKLLEGLDSLDWPEAIKNMQRNWIGKSTGAIIKFKVKNTEEELQVFTTRPDTIFGATYCVVAPEHPLLTKLKLPKEVVKYQKDAKAKTDLERTDLQKDKTGVYLNYDAINPLTGENIPIYVADYVLNSYGTGAIMAVPAHDERDFLFASKYGLPVKQVLAGEKIPFTGDSKHINSSFLDNLNKEEATSKMLEYLTENNLGYPKVNYRLRDWIFSRQRYWGEPFPVVFDENGSIEVLSKNELPLTLPKLTKIKLSKNGESPLALATDWLYTERNGKRVRRETNTMPQWSGSCWYYFGYLLKDGDVFLDPESVKAQKRLKAWLPVDLYIGGTEHAVLHLLYARFWHKVLFDEKIVPSQEPFQKLFNQGMILGKDGNKMSKSMNNGVNPDDIVSKYGADTLRLYEMFLGPLEASKPWQTDGIEGPYRFLERVWRFYTEVKIIDDKDTSLDKIYNSMVKKVTEDYYSYSFNTAISQMMIFINECFKVKKIKKTYLEGFLVLLNPLAPHITEELNELLGNKEMLVNKPWPVFDENKIAGDKVLIVVSINGKVRDKVEALKDMPDADLKKLVIKLPKIVSQLENKEILKTIVVKNKLVNIVIK